MSIEIEIAKLTTAVETLAKVIVAQTNVVTSALPVQIGSNTTHAVAPTHRIHAVGTVSDPTPPAAAQPAPVPPVQVAESSAPGAEVIPYSAVKSAVNAFAATHGSGPTIKILEGFGVSNATKLTPDQYGPVIEAFKSFKVAA
jgi:hypothetical protein